MKQRYRNGLGILVLIAAFLVAGCDSNNLTSPDESDASLSGQAATQSDRWADLFDEYGVPEKSTENMLVFAGDFELPKGYAGYDQSVWAPERQMSSNDEECSPEAISCGGGGGGGGDYTPPSSLEGEVALYLPNNVTGRVTTFTRSTASRSMDEILAGVDLYRKPGSVWNNVGGQSVSITNTSQTALTSYFYDKVVPGDQDWRARGTHVFKDYGDLNEEIPHTYAYGSTNF